MDIIDGGAGIDLLNNVDCSNATTNFTITETGSPIYQAGIVNITNVEHFSTLILGNGNDKVTLTDKFGSTLNTGAGDDTISVISNHGSDNVDGGAGNDLLIVDYSSSDKKMVTGTTGLNGYQGVSAQYTDNKDSVLFKNIERFQITATKLDDFITTGDNNDTINAGAGNDTIVSGKGLDIIQLTTAGNVDTITDFSAVDDTIQLENAVFTKLTQTGTLAANLFRTGAGITTASDADDFLIYDSTTGKLYYDADANGGGAAVQIALIGNTTTHATLTAADFVVI